MRIVVGILLGIMGVSMIGYLILLAVVTIRDEKKLEPNWANVVLDFVDKYIVGFLIVLGVSWIVSLVYAIVCAIQNSVQ